MLVGRSKIVSICTEDGTKLENPSDVKAEIVRYYHNLLGTTPVHSANDLDSLSKAFPRRLTEAQQLVLAREVTD